MLIRKEGDFLSDTQDVVGGEIEPNNKELLFWAACAGKQQTIYCGVGKSRAINTV